MFLYTVLSTTVLTWMILIRPNSYTTESNAADWLLMMTLFVFLPMAVTAADRYQKQLEKARAKTGRQYRVQQDRQEERYAREMTGASDYAYTHSGMSRSNVDDNRIVYTEGYSRERFRRSGAAGRRAGHTQAA